MKFAIALAVCFLLGACGDAVVEAEPTPTGDPTPTADSAATEPTETAAEPSDPYVIEIDARAVSDTSVEVEGTTNLPDNSVVTVFASRAFRYESESDIRATNVAGDGVTVQDGTFSTTLALDESNLLLGLDLDPIEVISSDLDVCAEFRTGKDITSGEQRQPDASVVETVGEFGEALADSPQVTVFGSATDNPANWLEATEAVALSSPLIEDIEQGQGTRPTEEQLEGFCTS